MNSAMWSYFFMLMGILGIAFINIFGNVIIDNEQNYYMLKEVTEAAMIDAVDMKALREGIGWDEPLSGYDSESIHCDRGQPGTIRIIKEKFVESFTMRFAMNATLSKDYKIIINDIDECPPKVTVTLIAKQKFSLLQMFGVKYDSGMDIANRLTSILESNPNEYTD